MRFSWASKSVEHRQINIWNRKSLNQNLRIEYVVVYGGPVAQLG